MPVYAMILREVPVRLWGLSSRQRLKRMLGRMGIARLVDDTGELAVNDSVLILRGDYLFDDRILRGLGEQCGILLQAPTPDGLVPVAAHASAAQALQARRLLLGEATPVEATEMRCVSPADLAAPYRRNLRQFDTPCLLPIAVESRSALEKRLFAGSYKGVTDLVTKWVWPLPARWVTRGCVRLGATPNMVTTISLLLVVLAGIFFLRGEYGRGLLCAWVMTFLDTVDGKLARVTVSYTPFGHLFDHLIDLLSPPLWYIAWGQGLVSFPFASQGLTLSLLYGLLLAGYAGGRGAEGLFKHYLERSGLFCWRPVDSCFRLITGRRNPNLILLTLGFLAGRPDLGFVAVVFWTVASTLFLLGRLIQGWKVSRSSGPLHSWFEEIDPENPPPSLAAKWFVRRPDQPTGHRV